jgi:GAF domain-containing protein
MHVSGAGVCVCDPEREEIIVYEELTANKHSYRGSVLKYGEGAAGIVAQTGKPLIIDDYRNWLNRVAMYEEEKPYTATLSVPMTWHGQVTGVLQVTDDQIGRHFTQSDAELLSLLGDQAAIAIENTRLLQAERTVREQAEALREAARIVGSSLSLDEVLQAVLDQLARVLPFDSGCIMFVEDERSVIKVWRGYDVLLAHEHIAGIQFPITTDPYIGAVVREAKPLVLRNTHEDSNWVMTPIGEHINSWLGIPLMGRDKVIGLFSLDRMISEGFTDEEVALAQTFAPHAATAIENARLFEAEEKRAAELMALRQASLNLTASLELEQVLYAALESALRFLPGCVYAHIFLYDQEHGGALEFGAALKANGSRGQLLSGPRPKGLSYTVVTTGQPVVMNEVSTHPVFDNYHPQGQVSALGLPLKIGQRVLGVMNLTHPYPHIFTQSEIHILSLLGDQVAIAIENAHLFQQAETERRHLGLLYDLGRGLAASLQHEEILQRATTLTCQALDGLVGGAFLYNAALNQLILQAVHGQKMPQDDAAGSSIKISIHDSMAGWVALNRTAVVCPDVNQDPRWKPIPGLDEEARSAILAPIMDSERLMGVLSVTHRQANAFSEDHLDLLQVICQQVALALSNAESYAQVENLVDMLAAEQRRLESLVELLPAGVLLLDDNYRLLIANLLGRQIISRLNPDQKGGVLHHLGPYPVESLCTAFVSSDSPEQLPIEIDHAGPPHMIIEAEARLIGNETRQWVITMRDVTQEREIQERVRLQERLATVGQLAAGIAHDFNNIMAAILVYTDLLMGDRSLPNLSRDRLTIIQQQVQRASSLIRQILDFSRRSMMEQHPLDLLPFVKELDKLLSRVLPETIHLELKYQPGSYVVNGDPTRLQQVFMNLAVNARDAMPEGGSLCFEISRFQNEVAGRQPYSGLPEGDWICINVKDSGGGIPAEVLPFVFDPFFTTKPVGQGTGLGLAQVYGIVRQHQGYIDVTSQAGQGTEFKIFLPALVTIEDLTNEDTTPVQVDGGGLYVLLAEDDPATLEALKALLEAQNFKVLTAHTGQEAYQIYEKWCDTILLVVSDVVMPQMGGVALYQILRQRWPQARILLITGHPMESEDQILLETGDVHWLQKPFSVQEFIATVQAVLGE